MKSKYFFSFAAVMALSVIVSCGSVEKSEKKDYVDTEVGVTETTCLEAGDTDAQELTFELTDSMQVEEDGNIIIQTDTVNGITYSLTVNLEKAAGYTTNEQIITCTKIFWYCYPKMYEKMAVENTPVNINLIIEDEGYEIAEQWENNVHLHDRWLFDCPGDYDCLTHEFAHVIQTDWDGEYSPRYGEDAYLIERFADACRYMYAYEDGLYNNNVWNLWTPDEESDYASSVRFWVWIEQTFSNDQVDIFSRLVKETQIKDDAHEFSNWESDGAMWDVIFEGTDAYGKSLDDLWSDFLNTEFAWEVM